MRIALAQLNPTVADIDGNTSLVLDAIDRARTAGADLLVTPEQMVLGYPARDIIFREGLVARCESAVKAIAEAAQGVTVIVGHPARAPAESHRPFYNAATVVRDGQILATYRKRLFPGYDVFDEDRYFAPGGGPLVIEIAGTQVGVIICEDFWGAADVPGARGYAISPLNETVEAGAEVIVSLNASPFIAGKGARHETILRETARQIARPIVAVNLVGGNDDLVFDGRSMIVNERGEVALRCAPFEAETTVGEIGGEGLTASGREDPIAEVWAALVLGTRDYVRKTGHTDLVLGLSGGIDSAVCAVIGAAAVGGDHVTGLLMPSRYSSEGSLTDAHALADALGVRAQPIVPIADAHESVATALTGPLDGPPADLADENIQARLRGLLLMTWTNARPGTLLLATSNKSELAVGYSTLYGDMCGAVSPIGDVLKTDVYRLARWVNDNAAACGFDRPPIPESSITKPPSAELRPDQTDQDSLPPYDVLDEIIARWVDREESRERILAETGFDEAVVRTFVRMIDMAEYKRFQGSVILKTQPRAFGRGRPMPIVARPG